MDIAHVRRLLTTGRFGREIRYFASIGSTMDDARAHPRAGAAEELAVVADEQTAGRGRLGRTWVAPAGVNLYVSILVRPPLAVLKRLGMVAPLAVADAVREVAGLDVAFKWPNDILIGGRKLCGVLIEGELAGQRPDFAVVGIGLNVNLEPDRYPEIAGTATSLARELGRPVSREATLAALLNAFERCYDREDGEALRLAWRACLETLGREVTVTFAGRSEEGIAEDVDAEGALVMRRADGSTVALPAGEVTLRR